MKMEKIRVKIDGDFEPITPEQWDVITRAADMIENAGLHTSVMYFKIEGGVTSEMRGWENPILPL
jgi:hypothetical protein